MQTNKRRNRKHRDCSGLQAVVEQYKRIAFDEIERSQKTRQLCLFIPHIRPIEMKEDELSLMPLTTAQEREIAAAMQSAFEILSPPRHIYIYKEEERIKPTLSQRIKTIFNYIISKIKKNYGVK